MDKTNKRWRVFDRMKRLVGCFRCHCGKLGWMKRRRMNTRYVNEEENWIRCCDDCFEEIVDNYRDLWNSLY